MIRNDRNRTLHASALAALLVCGVTAARAAIAPDAQSAVYATGTTVVLPHTVGAGNNRVVVVGVSIFLANRAVTSLTYAGVPLSRLGSIDGGGGTNDRRVEVWMLVAPPVGAADVVVTLPGDTKVVVGAASFFGVDPLSPTGGFSSNEAQSSVATITVPSAPGELVMDVLAVKGNAAAATAAPGQTTLWNLFAQANPGHVLGAASTRPGDDLVAMSWNLSASEYWVIGAISLKPAPPPPVLSLTKGVDLAAALPGEDVTYTVVGSSDGGLSDATGIVVVDSIPDYAGFQIGSATFDAGTSALTSTLAYSDDSGATWTYVPASGGCAAPAGYDYCVTHVRWTLAGTMPPSQFFQIGMAVRVR